jgi:hypothetical protein
MNTQLSFLSSVALQDEHTPVSQTPQSTPAIFDSEPNTSKIYTPQSDAPLLLRDLRLPVPHMYSA